MAGEAEVKFLDGDFRIVRPGAFVRCAVTGVPIPLEELKYWSVDLQEAYASPEAVLQRQAGGAREDPLGPPEKGTPGGKNEGGGPGSRVPPFPGGSGGRRGP